MTLHPVLELILNYGMFLTSEDTLSRALDIRPYFIGLNPNS